MSGWYFAVVLVLPFVGATERYERAWYEVLQGGALLVATEEGNTTYAPGAWLRCSTVGVAVKR